jgi:IclR family acetate operon transcriptional repressor
MSKQDYRIAAVDKTLDILEFLGQQRKRIGLPELSVALGIPKATLFRYMVTLEGRGYVRKGPDDDNYALGYKVLELGSHVLGNLTLHEVALPHMKDLQARFHETVNLGVLDGNEVVYIEILESRRAFKMSSRVGGRDMPHATSLGKAILAFLPEEEVERIAGATGLPRRTANTICSLPQLKQELASTRQRGYAIDDGENEEGARCVGAPIFDRRGNVSAALSVSGPAFRTSAVDIEDLGTALAAAALQISRGLGYGYES